MDIKKKKYRNYILFSEKSIVHALNRIRRGDDRLFHGFFKLKTLKNISDGNHYRIFYLPKKHCGKRRISVPEKELKYIQTCLSEFLNEIYVPNEYTYGFIRGKSIVDNAKQHINKDIILNIDLKDFFDSISYDRIIENLMRFPYLFSYKAAKLITDLTTVNTGDGNFVLPQGAPSSPIMTNIITYNLDLRLSGFAKKHNMTYTRYADDITFSFNRSLLRGWRGHGLDYKYGIYEIIINSIIRNEGFEINERKTRISFVNQRHEVTGLVVNEIVNVKREYIKKLRTELHNWEKDGYIVSSYKFLNHYESSHPKRKLTKMENVIYGKLSFIKMVKGKDDSTYQKLRKRYEDLCFRDKVFIEA